MIYSASVGMSGFQLRMLLACGVLFSHGFGINDRCGFVAFICVYVGTDCQYLPNQLSDRE